MYIWHVQAKFYQVVSAILLYLIGYLPVLQSCFIYLEYASMLKFFLVHLGIYIYIYIYLENYYSVYMQYIYVYICVYIAYIMYIIYIILYIVYIVNDSTL